MPVPLDQWNQFGANPAGSGFRAVRSTAATAPGWQLAIPGRPPSTGTSSPVLGPDGTIYLGTHGGLLVAVRPDGSIKWTTSVIDNPSTDVKTPAVAADGTVYCVCTERRRRQEPPRPGPRSFVVSVTADGRIRWRVPIRAAASEFGDVNGVIDGAPRIVSSAGKARILFTIDYTLSFDPESPSPNFVSHLAIVDEAGAFRSFHRYDESRIFIDAHGGGGLGGGATVGTPPPPPGPKLRGSAVRDSPVVLGSFPATTPLTIVVATGEGLRALKWNDAERTMVSPSPVLKLDVSLRRGSGPAAFANGLVGYPGNGRVTLIDADTFTLFTPKRAELSRDANGAGGLRQMYYVARTGVLSVVDTNSAVPQRRPLEADSIAFPALSGNHVHVSTTTGLRTFTLKLEPVSAVALPRAGQSSPAIGSDGSVYVVAQSTLFAFLNR